MRTGLLTFAAMFYSSIPQPTNIDTYRENYDSINKIVILADSGLDRSGCTPVTSYWNEQYVAIVDLCIDGHYKIISMDYKNLLYWRVWDYQALQYHIETNGIIERTLLPIRDT